MEQIQIQALSDRSQTTEDAIKKFQDTLPEVQKQLFKKTIRFLRTLETVNGKIKPNLANLKAINRFVNVELKHTVRNGQYASNVIAFTKIFGKIASLTDKYFKPIENAGQ